MNQEPAPQAAIQAAPFVSSLGMKFVPVPGTKPLFGVWEMRVRWDDAKAFWAWLSGTEAMEHRLPSDHEWSGAVGIGT